MSENKEQFIYGKACFFWANFPVSPKRRESGNQQLRKKVFSSSSFQGCPWKRKIFFCQKALPFKWDGRNLLLPPRQNERELEKDKRCSRKKSFFPRSEIAGVQQGQFCVFCFRTLFWSSFCTWLAPFVIDCRCCIPTNAQGNATWKQYNSFLSTVCLSVSVSFSPSLFARKSVMGNCGGHTSVCRRRRRRRRRGP